jgi:hypothetical protein
MIFLCPKGYGECEDAQECIYPGRCAVTIFLCGPSKCEHDYSRYEQMEGGETAVCMKCGARAFDEAAWL